MSASWNTTVTELFGILHQALVALVPIAEKARVPWRDGEAYDDWDAIAGCLYDNLVVRAISCAKESAGLDMELPKYDITYPSYEGAFIQVEGGGIPNGITAVFVGFAGTSPDFVNVKWVRMLHFGNAPEQTVEYSPYDACKFYLVHAKGAERRKVHALTIEI
jgi:hypothetical protein